jgi:hypothetical protein
MFSPFVPSFDDATPKDQVVKETARWHRDKVLHRHALLLKTFCEVCRVDFIADDVQIACEDDLLPFGNEIPNPNIQSLEEAHAKLRAALVPVGRAVDTEKDKGGKLKDDTSTLGI